ncbi:MAG: DNA translocase FtsK 4TM domain-containing protein [Puniceicoccales bacterium]|nr:DNA translocase FtsK 4TM domain-containing protein [Puniceicoccales bacterium]
MAGLGLAALALLLAAVLVDFSPQQSHFVTTNYAAEANNLAGTLGSTAAFWLFRMLGGAAIFLPAVPLALFFALIFPKKFSLWSVAFAVNFTVFTAIFLGWWQKFLPTGDWHALTAGAGGIAGTLLAERIFLPLLGKWGTFFTTFTVLLLQVALPVAGFLKRHPFAQKLFSCAFTLFKFPINFLKNRLKKRKLPPLPTPANFQGGEKNREAKSSPPDDAQSVRIIEETALSKTSVPLKKRDSDYIFPTIDLLESSKNGSKQSAGQGENHGLVARKLVEVLAQFGVQVTPGEIHKGPVITRYEVTPDAGIRVEKIVNLDKNIALGLAAKSVRIIAPVPGKGCVGIELPNTHAASVHLREILESKNWADMEATIPIVLGRGVTGEPIIYDLAKMPHLLIAGATGSGKTVCINAIIASLLYHASPEDLRFIMVDPKIVEMQNYNRLPHMLVPVVTDPKKVPGALKWLIAEMELRYKIFAKAGARNIANYNEKLNNLQKLAAEDGVEYKKFPYIVCIIDELADLMMVAPGDIETYIARLAQLARAAGIHLVLATQRPSVNVITGIIKANLPCRIAFKVSSKVDSRTILDSGGAEALLGQGDMLFSPPGASGLLRAQGALVSDDEINGIVKYLFQKNGGPKFEEAVQKEMESDGDSISGDGNWEDELIPRALEIIRSNDHASTSFLQRKLKIGYNRAARIMDTLRERGLVATETED